MQIQLQTDSNIDSNIGLRHHVEQVIRKSLQPYRHQIMRASVHLSDVNASRADKNDKRCVVEFHISGVQPMAVQAESDTVHRVLDKAAKKLRHVVSSMHAKQHKKRHAVVH